MHRSVLWFLRASYRKNEPAVLAQDETPADALRKAIEELSKRWLDQFDEMSGKLADYFAQSVEKHSTDALKKILKDGGMTVGFQVTPAVRDIMNATVHENVALIKSIPRQYLLEVEGIVMRGVRNGRDLQFITDELSKRYGITRRRAAFIAQDQSNKTTEAFGRARKIEVGIVEEEWVHSGGGHEPRPTHVKAGKDRVRYDIRKGWYDPAVGRHIFPGELPRCRCVGRPVVKGFS